jgi:peptidoglycan hydrolase-like protein with peptidoglycan-binding domain
MLASFAKAVTVDELMAQIAALQAQLSGLQGGSSVGMLTKNLMLGMTDPEVSILQQGLAKDAAVYAAGKVTGYFGPLTKAAVIAFQQKYASEVLTPVGLTKGTGYVGAMTRAKFNALYAAPVATPTPLPGATPTPVPTANEGSIVVKLNGNPADGTEVLASHSDVAVLSFDVKAQYSNMAVQRIYINTGLRPWLYVSDISLWDGSQMIAKKSAIAANFEEVTAGSDYRFTFDGINVIVPKDTTKTLTVKFSALNSPVTSSWASSGETITVKTNAVRAVDGLGLNQYGPDSGLSARTYDLKGATAAALEVLSNAGSPAEGVIQISSTTVTSDVPLFTFDVKSKDNGSTLKTVKVLLTSDTANIANVLTSAKLYQGSTLLTSYAITGTATTETATFDLTNLSSKITVGANAITTFTVKVDFKGVATAYQGKYVYASITGSTSNIVAEDVTDYSTPAVTGSASGKKAYAYLVFPAISFVSTPTPSIDPNDSSIGSVTLQVNVRGVGGDVYLATTTAFAAVSSASTSGTSYSVTKASSIDDSSNGNWIVRNGETKTVNVSVAMNNTGGTSGFVQAWLQAFKWNSTDSTGTYTTWQNGVMGMGTASAVGTSYYSNPVYLVN